ncbi:ABC transporter permease subunit [Erysipelothrix sp. HDW6C]|uniref:ABC transporter permease subunit n=1 Tax=Erysipelothrix sp. HDW6C TaxID=2714930 RepID=UPI00140A2B82|nr:ABC transporter permease subunit [Erysipelothrix sp. HDW6C]QIK70770.1 ABC transporter permease subunit [Erysipelothrix sp. HDW6C]
MISLVGLELRKAYQSRLLHKMTAIFLVMFLSLFGYYAVKDASYADRLLQDYSTMGSEYKRIADDVRSDLTAMDSDDLEYAQMRATLEYSERVQQYYSSQISKISSNGLAGDMNAIDERLIHLSDVVAGMEAGLDQSQQKITDVTEEITVLSYHRSQQIDLYSSPYTPNTLHFASQILSSEVIAICMLVTCLFVRKSIMDDYENRAFTLYLTTPHSKTSIYIAKTIAGLLVATLAIVSALLTTLILSFVLYGFGVPLYPVDASLMTDGIKILNGTILVAVQLGANVLFAVIVATWVLRGESSVAVIVLMYLLILMSGFLNHPSLEWIPLFNNHVTQERVQVSSMVSLTLMFVMWTATSKYYKSMRWEERL